MQSYISGEKAGGVFKGSFKVHICYKQHKDRGRGNHSRKQKPPPLPSNHEAPSHNVGKKKKHLGEKSQSQPICSCRKKASSPAAFPVPSWPRQKVSIAVKSHGGVGLAFKVEWTEGRQIYPRVDQSRKVHPSGTGRSPPKKARTGPTDDFCQETAKTKRGEPSRRRAGTILKGT